MKELIERLNELLDNYTYLPMEDVIPHLIQSPEYHRLNPLERDIVALLLIARIKK